MGFSALFWITSYTKARERLRSSGFQDYEIFKSISSVSFFNKYHFRLAHSMLGCVFLQRIWENWRTRLLAMLLLFSAAALLVIQHKILVQKTMVSTLWYLAATKRGPQKSMLSKGDYIQYHHHLLRLEISNVMQQLQGQWDLPDTVAVRRQMWKQLRMHYLLGAQVWKQYLSVDFVGQQRKLETCLSWVAFKFKFRMSCLCQYHPWYLGI